jgi:F-type H+/Na+-transporting ATPase subunit alpha
VAVILAGTAGYLDDIPVTDVKRFESDLLDYLRGRHGDLLDSTRTSGALPDDDALANAVAAFKDEFSPSDSTASMLSASAETDQLDHAVAAAATADAVTDAQADADAGEAGEA